MSGNVSTISGSMSELSMGAGSSDDNPVGSASKFDMVSQPPILQDDLITITSEAEADTLEECTPFLNSPTLPLNIHGVPHLLRPQHTMFLRATLLRQYPPAFVAIDPTRPWFLYWALTGLYCLGDDVSQYAERVAATLRPCQNRDGGFGGGHGQTSHIAASYAAVLSLIIVGGKEALDLIDRRAMWQWLGRMKQADGGFTMAQGGEEDIRGAYCSMTIISLLNLPLELPSNSPARQTGCETFLTGLGQWISRCQSFEGGIAGAPNNEAHGAYAFCGLACLAIIGSPLETFAKYLDLDSLIGWLSSQQRAPYGGFAGRTNKLVDGCYSHWVGGCWGLISAALRSTSTPSQSDQSDDLWSRRGLARYILCCAQNPKGGLRDKPSKYPDAYHSCYNLVGLSAAQYKFVYRTKQVQHQTIQDLGERIEAPFNWTVEGKADSEVCEASDHVIPVHPVFVVPFEKVQESRSFFESRLEFA